VNPFVNRLRSERGMTLPEMLVAMVLMLVIMTATLTTLDSGNANRRLNDDRNDAVERARSSIDNAVRQLRNLASPTASAPSAIDRAQATDFSFRTFDPSKRLVRYCLETQQNGAPITNRPIRLIQMLSTSDLAGSYDTCIADGPNETTGWNARRVVAQDVVNRRSVVPTGGDANNVDLFAYNSSSTDLSMIKNVRINLLLDINAANKRPSQVRLASGAALRNQNQTPFATFTVTKLSSRRFRMNGSSSSDPENRNLIFSWYAGVGANFTPSSTNQIGTGSVLDKTFDVSVGSPANYFIKLVVSDSNLTDTCPTSTGSTASCPSAGPLNWS
jgi:prepilin-type N-terminal cleavage/methylation domain-containing protein